MVTYSCQHPTAYRSGKFCLNWDKERLILLIAVSEVYVQRKMGFVKSNILLQGMTNRDCIANQKNFLHKTGRQAV